MKILLLDTAFSAIPIYNFLISTGHQVWTMGNRAADVLSKMAGGNWIEADYSSREVVAQHVATLGIERIVPGCTDISLETCLDLRLSIDLLDTPSVNHTLSNKKSFRNLCVNLGLPTPRVVSPETFPSTGFYICKPTDAFSGRGITVFDGKSDAALKMAYDTAMKFSRSNTIIFETFKQGELYSCSAFLEDNKIIDVFYVREGSSANPFAVDTSYVDYNIPERCRNIIEKSITKMSSELSLKDGLLHLQFILDEKMEPFIVEVTRRCPGDLYALLIEYSTGYKYAAKYASYFTGIKIDTSRNAQNYILRHTIASKDAEIFQGLVFQESLTVKAIFPIQSIGYELLEKQGNRVGVLFTEKFSEAEIIMAYEKFLNRRTYSFSSCFLDS